MIQDIFPHRFNNQFLADRAIEADDYVLHFRDNKLLMKVVGSDLEVPQKKDFPQINGDAQTTFLFTLDDV